MSSPLQVSVTIVTYNSSRFIRRCLESLLQQTGVRFDVTVVDNASTVEDRAALAQLAERDHRVTVVWSPENLGFGAGVNLGVRRLEPHDDVARRGVPPSGASGCLRRTPQPCR